MGDHPEAYMLRYAGQVTQYTSSLTLYVLHCGRKKGGCSVWQ